MKRLTVVLAGAVLAIGCGGSDHRSPKSDDRCPPSAPKAYVWTQSDLNKVGIDHELDERLHTPGCVQPNELSSSVLVCCP
jgi:hypothetical protein